MGELDCVPKKPVDMAHELEAATIAQLRRQLDAIYRDALGIVRTVELARGIPPERSAIRARAERRRDGDEG